MLCILCVHFVFILFYFILILLIIIQYAFYFMCQWVLSSTLYHAIYVILVFFTLFFTSSILSYFYYQVGFIFHFMLHGCWGQWLVDLRKKTVVCVWSALGWVRSNPREDVPLCVCVWWRNGRFFRDLCTVYIYHIYITYYVLYIHFILSYVY